jgi:bifunctional non-homologous end joining protein LigD
MLRARTPATTLGTKATFPGFIEPALATAAERRSLVHEIKFDVYRVQVHIMRGEGVHPARSRSSVRK